jgi:hypothetical protein
MKLTLLSCAALAPVLACTPPPDDVLVQLAPEVISSIDGTLGVHAVVLGERTPMPSEQVQVSVTYTDRNGAAHMIAPIDGTTDKQGAFDATISGLTWDGTGTISVSVPAVAMLSGSATFAVLDRTPPKVTITPPAAVLVAGTDATIQVHVTDEIGVSQVFFETSVLNQQGNRQRSSVVSSGATDATVSFDIAVPDTAAGTTLTLYALAADLSGNEGAAQPIMVHVQ